jgi:hypothetical protein
MSIKILRPLKKSRETHKYIKLNRLFTSHILEGYGHKKMFIELGSL